MATKVQKVIGEIFKISGTNSSGCLYIEDLHRFTAKRMMSSIILRPRLIRRLRLGRMLP